MSTIATPVVPVIEQATMTASPSATSGANVTPLGRLLTVSEVAEILRVHPNRVYELAARRALPAVRVGRLLRFHTNALHRWIMAGGTQEPATGVGDRTG
jgi:excisionase family DNA binding protein